MIELMRALLAVAPEVIRAIANRDGDLAKRRLREAMDREVDRQIAEARLDARKRSKREEP